VVSTKGKPENRNRIIGEEERDQMKREKRG
jgi:hypothetical protein